MRYFLLTLYFLYLSTSVSPGQVSSFRQLEENVYQLNNQFKYNDSQALLLPVLENERFSADEKYQAALLLSYTYKRLMDYQSTLQFLGKARQFAQKTTRHDQQLAEILGEEALVYFDIHNYAKSDSMMRVLEQTGFRHIDLETKSKLVMQQGYLLFLDKQYDQAEATYNRAIGWMRASSPCDLPMILVKKMQLYAAMNQMDRLQEAFLQSTRSADSCGIIKYHIYAHEELRDIYKARTDLAGMATTDRALDSLNAIYAQAANIAALHNQKETILLKEKDQKLQHEESQRTVLMAILAGVLPMTLALLIWLLLYRRQKRRLEAEFRRIKADMETYISQSRSTPIEKSITDKEALNVLSDRQREVLHLMAEGMSNREIAERLFISENTVKYHIKNIYQLLALKDRKDLLVSLKK